MLLMMGGACSRTQTLGTVSHKIIISVGRLGTRSGGADVGEKKKKIKLAVRVSSHFRLFIGSLDLADLVR